MNTFIDFCRIILQYSFLFSESHLSCSIDKSYTSFQQTINKYVNAETVKLILKKSINLYWKNFEQLEVYVEYILHFTIPVSFIHNHFYLLVLRLLYLIVANYGFLFMIYNIILCNNNVYGAIEHMHAKNSVKLPIKIFLNRFLV